MPSVNHRQIKRAAHRLGRHDSNWNPFSHTWKSRKDRQDAQRRETWDGTDLEAQQGRDDTTSPIVHAQTAPEPFLRQSEEEENAPTSSKEIETRDTSASQPESGDTFVGSQSTGANLDAQDGTRMRAGKRTSKPNPAPEEEPKKQKKESRFVKHVEPKEPFTFANQLQRTFLNSWVNVLILAAPAGIALNYVPGVNKIAVFVVNFIAIIPLAAMLSFATEEIALRTGETLGGLLNATFGNAVELIVAIIALLQNKPLIVKTSLVGSILSNLLLVLGMCFFFGGLRREKQHFNTVVAQTAASMLALAVAAVIVPTVFDQTTDNPASQVAQLSRGTSVILLVVYAAYLYFQLHTHHAVFSAESQKVPMRPSKSQLKQRALAQGLATPVGIMGAYGIHSADDNEKLRTTIRTPPHGEEDEDDGEEPQLHFFVALATLLVSTVIIAFCAEFMVDGIDAITHQGGLSAEFVGLILLPIVGNAAEHATAVTVAIKDKMDLAIGVAIGSSMQVALFLIPLLVIIGWGLGNDDMSLSFDVFQVAVLFVSVLLVNYLIADGQSHWLEGMLLMCLYCIIAVCSYWYPLEENGSSSGSSNSTSSSHILLAS
ncbi:Calcium/proton exchanger [Thozetella sp. PMI_491]|nr:Calcium/proton exchanger [Thozetella sp. PMI_491]